MTAELRATIAARRKAGEYVKTLCKEFGISESALSDLMATADAPVRTQRITAQHIEGAARLHESGLTVKEVLGQVGYSIGTIGRVLHERGVTMRTNGAPNVKRNG